MPSAPASLTVEVVRAEWARFRHPLLFLHGLWTGSWIWSDLAGYLAHRGWESWAPSLLGESYSPDAEERVRALTEVCRAMPAPPVIVAHDAALGAASALALAVHAPAIVAIAPWLPPRGGRLGLLSDRRFWAGALFAALVAPPTGEPLHPSLVGIQGHLTRLRPDSGPFFRSLFSDAERLFATARSQTGLVIAARDDRATSVDGAKRLASELQWSFDVHETSGHFPMLTDDRRERLADQIHRWIVQAIGRELLLWEDGEEDG